MRFKKITDLPNLDGRVLLLRTDMNVPLADGIITDATRIQAGAKTIDYALKHGAKVIIATHLGRPEEGCFSVKDSVVPIAQYLSTLLKCPIPIITDIDNAIDFSVSPVVMLENVRFNIGEKTNSDDLGQKYAGLCDIFVYDAFATAHRAEASTVAVGGYAKEVCAGLLLSSELSALTDAIVSPIHPVVAIVGGSKISTKLTILNNLVDKVDYLIVGGGILNTFLLSQGYNLGKSIVENDLVGDARLILAKMTRRSGFIPLPHVVVTAKEFTTEAAAQNTPVDKIADDDIVLDIGVDFANELAAIIKKAGTIIWNGPIGVFEWNQFSLGTKIVAQAIANSGCFSLAGGGDTIAAINKFGLASKISYISTAGGALLEFLEGKKLPAIAMLENRYTR